ELVAVVRVTIPQQSEEHVHEHWRPPFRAQAIPVGIFGEQPTDQLDQRLVERGGPWPLPAIVERRPRQAEPAAQLRDRHHLPLRSHGALHRQKAVSGFPDRAANFFRASSSSTSSPILARSSRTSASCAACSSSARALSPRSPPFTNVSIHASTSDCLRSCSRHTSTSFRSPRIS